MGAEMGGCGCGMKPNTRPVKTLLYLRGVKNRFRDVPSGMYIYAVGECGFGEGLVHLGSQGGNISVRPGLEPDYLDTKDEKFAFLVRLWGSSRFLHIYYIIHLPYYITVLLYSTLC